MRKTKNVDEKVYRCIKYSYFEILKAFKSKNIDIHSFTEDTYYDAHKIFLNKLIVSTVRCTFNLLESRNCLFDVRALFTELTKYEFFHNKDNEITETYTLDDWKSEISILQKDLLAAEGIVREGLLLYFLHRDAN